jgi:hypothetical protein
VGKPPETLVQDELKPSEQLLWTGWCITKRGNQCGGTGSAGSLLQGALLGFMAGAFIIRVFAPDSPAIFLLTMPLSALLLVWASRGEYRKRQALYVLTDRRVFAWSRLYLTVHVRTLPLNQIASVVVDYRDHDRHTVLFNSWFPDGGDAERPYLRFRLVSNKNWMLALLRDLRPDLTITATAPPVARERKSMRLRDHLPGRRT